MATSSSSSSSTSGKQPPLRRPTVVVIAGPTAVGKSALGLALCSALPGRRPGEIVSADSVQVYRHLDVGSNKASPEERAAVRHHLLDVIDPDERFTAGRFVRDADAAIAEILAAGGEELHSQCQQTQSQQTQSQQTQSQQSVYPVVVGGTPLYLQWFVHGPPDAPPSTPETAAAVAALLRPFEEARDWEGGLALLANFNFGATADDEKGSGSGIGSCSDDGDRPFAARAAELNANDWYRLARALEVAMAAVSSSSSSQDDAGAAAAGGETPLAVAAALPARSELYDLRCFFLCPADRLALFERIDARCEQLVLKGMLAETGRLLAEGTLRPDSMAGRAIGYRQTIEYLCRGAAAVAPTATSDGAAKDGGQEEETVMVDGEGEGGASSSSSSSSLSSSSFTERGDVAAFDAFFDKFGTATRNYAAQQLKWFRKDKAFVFVPVHLDNSGIGSSSSSSSSSSIGSSSSSGSSSGGGSRALETVLRLSTCPRSEYEAEVMGAAQVAIREDLVKQGKKMRTYAPKRRFLTRPPPPPPPPSKTQRRRQMKEAAAAAAAARAAREDAAGGESEAKRKRTAEPGVDGDEKDSSGTTSDQGSGSGASIAASPPVQHLLDEALAAADAAVDTIAAAGVLDRLRREQQQGAAAGAVTQGSSAGDASGTAPAAAASVLFRATTPASKSGGT